jgi:hypothetical protein
MPVVVKLSQVRGEFDLETGRPTWPSRGLVEVSGRTLVMLLPTRSGCGSHLDCNLPANVAGVGRQRAIGTMLDSSNVTVRCEVIADLRWWLLTHQPSSRSRASPIPK